MLILATGKNRYTTHEETSAVAALNVLFEIKSLPIFHKSGPLFLFRLSNKHPWLAINLIISLSYPDFMGTYIFVNIKDFMTCALRSKDIAPILHHLTSLKAFKRTTCCSKEHHSGLNIFLPTRTVY